VHVLLHNLLILTLDSHTSKMDEPPFTPPPHYVPVQQLPRRQNQRQSPLEELDRNALIRAPSIPRRSSHRASQSEGRITKSTRSKKRRPGLSIDTTVTRHKAKPPRELNPIEIQQSSIAASTTQPWQATESGVSAAAKNSPSRFPTAYLDASKRETLRVSPGHQDLYFAPPPNSRRTSSVYSRATRSTSTKEDPSRQRSMKTRVFNPPSSRPVSIVSNYDADSFVARQRYQSGGTLFEEDGVSTMASVPDTAYTITPHRSRGWWNVITTPFDSRPGTAVEYRSPSEGEKTPAVPSIPAQFVNPLSSPMRRALTKAKSPASAMASASNTLSPDEREIPIMLDARSFQQVNNNSAEPRPRNSPQATTASTLKRMPFADVGKSPASGNSEFSPAGMVAGEGNVGGTTTVVNVVVPEHHHQHGQTVEILSVPDTEPSQGHRHSFREAVNRTARFISPHSSGPSVPVENRNLEPIPPTPKSVRFARQSFFQAFSPPPQQSRGSSGEYFEEFEIDDKPPMKTKKESWWTRLMTNHRRKKLEKKRNKDQDKKEKKKMSKRRKCCFCCLCLLLSFIVMLVLIIVLAVTMTRKHKHPATTVVWTNITNMPPIPNGALTIARPNLVGFQQACVNPYTMWSCAVPKEQQSAISPNAPNQPNFVLDVFYDNSTTPPVVNKRSSSGAVAAGYFGQLVRRSTFTPSPGPPSIDDYIFLGNSTDNITAPFQGESTPFYISMITPGDPPPQQSPTKVKREPQSSQTVNSIPNPASAIPVPSLNPDGTPPPANLLPFPSYQPVRLFNRGLPTEHYGFYTYFDRNIFLRSNTVQQSTQYIPADDNGGSTQMGANVRCTWQQTRFFVQIWTNMHNATLIAKAPSGSKIANGDFSAPGSFPYPVTLTLDRHGGDATVKALYCFGLNADGKLNVTERQFQVETRDFGGTVVNPARGPFTNATDVSIANGGPGGVDGGTGGCYCKWQNFS
jgi:hypothetical protein